MVEALAKIADADYSVAVPFLRNLGEWDFWFMVQAQHVIVNEFSGVPSAQRRCRSGVSFEKLPEVSSSLRAPEATASHDEARSAPATKVVEARKAAPAGDSAQTAQALKDEFAKMQRQAEDKDAENAKLVKHVEYMAGSFQALPRPIRASEKMSK